LIKPLYDPIGKLLTPYLSKGHQLDGYILSPSQVDAMCRFSFVVVLCDREKIPSVELCGGKTVYFGIWEFETKQLVLIPTA